jgi:hypothetical protein
MELSIRNGRSSLGLPGITNPKFSEKEIDGNDGRAHMEVANRDGNYSLEFPGNGNSEYSDNSD